MKRLKPKSGAIMSNNLSYRVYMTEPRKDKPHKMDIPVYLTSFDTYKKAAAFFVSYRNLHPPIFGYALNVLAIAQKFKLRLPDQNR